jgi:hypothetical protein
MRTQSSVCSEQCRVRCPVVTIARKSCPISLEKGLAVEAPEKTARLGLEIQRMRLCMALVSSPNLPEYARFPGPFGSRVRQREEFARLAGGGSSRRRTLLPGYFPNLTGKYRELAFRQLKQVPKGPNHPSLGGRFPTFGTGNLEPQIRKSNRVRSDEHPCRVC